MIDPAATKSQNEQPPPVTNSCAQHPEQWKTIVAKVVLAYKLFVYKFIFFHEEIALFILHFHSVQEQNVSQGKIAMAVIQSDRRIRFILYRSKTQILSTLTMDEEQQGADDRRSSSITIKPDYLQYFDDDGHFWSLHFEGNDRSEILTAIGQSVDDMPIVETATETSPPSLHVRMTKMGGHQLLPLAAASAHEEIDEYKEADDDDDPPNKWKPDVPTRRSIMPFNGSSTPTSIAATSTLISYNPIAAADCGLNSFLSENRIQNTEVRMNLSKLESKIERVIDKLDSLSGRTVANSKCDNDDDELLLLEEKLLTMKKENRQLRLQVVELKEQNRRCREQHNEADDAATLMADNERLRRELTAAKAETVQLDNVRQSDEKKLLDKLQAIERHSEQEISKAIASLNAVQLEQTTDRADAEKRIATLTDRVAEQNDEIHKLTKEIDGGKSDRNVEIEKIRTVHAEQIGETVRNIMNALYQQLQSEIGDADVLRICRKLIKAETAAALRSQANIK